MQLSRRETCGLAGAVLVFGAPVASAQTRNIEIISARLPDTIREGGTFTAGVTLGNKGEETVTVTVKYYFDGEDIAQMDEVRIAPGESRKISLPNMEYAWLEQSPGVTPGETYTHSIGVPGGPTASAEVEIVPSDSSSGDGTPTQDESGGETPADSQSGGSTLANLELVESRVPKVMERGTPYRIGAVVANSGSSMIRFDISYEFEGQVVFSEQGVELPPGEDGFVGFHDVMVESIEESLGQRLDPGDYTHSFGMPDSRSRRISREVEIVPAGEADSMRQADSSESTGGDDSGSSNLDGSESVEASTAGDGEGDTRQRGFFSNSGDEPEALSNPLNLTTLGFLLSVGGIAHQMLQG